MSKKREVAEGTQPVGEDEEVVFTVDVTNWGDSPTSPSVVVKNLNADTDVTSTVMPTGSPSVNGNVITLPTIKLLTKNISYRIEVKFTIGGNVLECYIPIGAEE